MQERFTLASLAAIDGGRIAAAFEHALARCEADCRDRPTTDSPRKVTIHVTIVPVPGEDRTLESCDLRFHITDAVPKRESKRYNMAAAAKDGLLFNELSPEDVHQQTIDQAQKGPRKVADVS